MIAKKTIFLKYFKHEIDFLCIFLENRLNLKVREKSNLKYPVFLIFIILLGFPTKFNCAVSTSKNPNTFKKGSNDGDSINIGGTLSGTGLNRKNIHFRGNFSGIGLNCQNIHVRGDFSGIGLNCQNIQVNGFSNIHGLQAENIVINGEFLGKNIKISGIAEFYGRLEIENGELNQIQMSCEEPTFINTKISGNINITFSSYSDTHLFGFINIRHDNTSPNIIKLKGNSIVFGDIIFKNAGEVHLYDESEIRGKVTNGKIVKQR